MTAGTAGAPASGTYLLDTNILVHYARGKAIAARLEADYALISSPSRPLTCIVSHGETHALAKRLSWGPAKVAALRHLLALLVPVNIDDPRVIDEYAELDFWSQARGRKMGKNDLWIAATTKVTGATLMTTDRDFDHLVGVHLSRALIDPSTGATLP